MNAPEVDDAPPPSGDDMRLRLVSDRVGGLDRQAWLAAGATAAPAKRSRRSRKSSEARARGEIEPPLIMRRETPPDRFDVPPSEDWAE